MVELQRSVQSIIGAIDTFLDIDRSGLSFIGWRFGYRKTVSLTDGVHGRR
jgi:hypothetical protein